MKVLSVAKDAVKKNHGRVFEVIFILFFLTSLMVKSFYFQFTTKINMKPFTSNANVTMLIASFSVFLIILTLLILFFSKKRILLLILVDLLLSLLIFSDTLYYRYYYSAVTIPVLYQLGLVGDVAGSVFSLLKTKDMIYFLNIPVMVGGLILLNKFRLRPPQPLPVKVRAMIAAIVFILGFTGFQYAYHNTDTNTINYDKNHAMKVLGVMYFHYLDVKNFVKTGFSGNALEDEEKSRIEAYFKSKEKTGDQLKNLAKGKNLIVIQMEALQQFVINAKVNGKEVTPNLNRLLKEGVYFDNFYNQVLGGNTSDAEFLTNASLYPLKEGAVYFRYPNNEYQTLPKKLKEQGYDSYAFHAYTPGFWNRATMYQAIGFDKYINYNDYTIDEYVGWGGYALSDASFYRQSLSKINTKNPFYGFFITLSSHHPYTYFETKGEFDPGEYKGTLLGRYLKSIYYADTSVGKFIETLKKKGLYENTLIVIYGDHAAIPKDQSQDLAKFLGISYDEYELERLQRVPLIMLCPGLEKGKTISTTGGQVDILPTIGNLMGFETPYAMGQDLFNAKKGFAIIKKVSFATDQYVYVSSLDKAFDIKTKEPVSPDVYEGELDRLLKEFDLSNLMIEKNALKKIKASPGSP